MRSTELLISEHDNILRMLDVIHRASLRILGGAAVDIDDFKKIVAFIRGYADKTHHNKEEEFLFLKMVEDLGDMGDNLVRRGMLVEHDIARLYVSDLDEALDAYAAEPTDESKLAILVAAGSYEKLLCRHIDKENAVVFNFGDKNLPAASRAWVEEQVAAFEADADNAAKRDEQLAVLAALEQKYQ